MKRLAFILVLVLCAASSSRAQTVGAYTISDSCSGTTSCSGAGSHRMGDIAIAWAYRAGSATAPTLPAAMTNITNGSSATGANRSWRMGCEAVSSTSSLSSGTWTNATNMGMVFIRGTGDGDTASCNTVGVGAIGTANNVSSATATYSALTLNNSGDIALLVMGSSTSGNTCTPSTATNISGATTGDVRMSLANATGNWASNTCSITSSVTTEIVIDIQQQLQTPACTSGCPAVAQYKQWGFTTQAAGSNSTDFFYHLDQAAGTGNTVACAMSWFDSAQTITQTVALGGTNMTAGTKANNAGGTTINWFWLANAGGKQDIHVTFSSAVFSVKFLCYELYGVPTSSPEDVMSGSMSASSVQYVQPGSMTTTANNDIILVADFIDGDNVGLNNVTAYWAPLSNWTLDGNSQQNPAAYHFTWNSNGAINPGMVAYQSTSNNWGVTAVAFKASSGTGTAPTGYYIARDVTENTNTASYVRQMPCSGNLEVMGAAVYQITGITADTDSNTWNILGTTTLVPSFAHADNYAGCGSADNNYRTVTIANNTPSTPDALHFYDMVGMATSSVVDTGVTSSTSGATVTSGRVNVSGTQGSNAASDTVCTSNASVNTVLNFTPVVTRGIAIVAEATGMGPTCGASVSTGDVFDAAWFAGENDSCCGSLDSSSTYGHISFNTASAWTWTSEWANHAAGSASGFDIGIVAFKAAPLASLAWHPFGLLGVGN